MQFDVLCMVSIYKMVTMLGTNVS